MNALPLPGDGPERLLQHADALRRLARRLVRDDAEADDLVQETWTSVLEKPREHEPAAGWKRWLFGVARNLARERRRSEGRRTRREHTAARPEAESAGTEIVEQLETFRMLADELSRLEEPYRSTLYRRYFEGHTNERIAADDGIAEPSVRSRVSRGLALLRERLERRESDDRGGWADKRGGWIVLLRRIAYDEPRLAPRFGLPFLALSAAMAVVTTVIVVAFLRTHGSTHDATGQAALEPSVGRAAANEAALVDARSEESAGSTRVTLASAHADEKPSLHLVDLRTHEPLAGFELRVGALGANAVAAESRVSRADGSVDLPLAHGAFDVALTLIDHPSLDILRRAHSGGRAFAWTIPPVHFAPGAGACTLGIAVGPRFELRFEPPLTVPIGSLHAEIFATDKGSTRASSVAPLRASLDDGGRCWVRFLDEATYLGGAPPFRLRIADDSGFLCGETEVATLVGSSQQPLTITLAPRGSLRVDARCAQGRPLDARLVLSRSGRVVARIDSTSIEVVIGCLEEGDYEVLLESSECETIRTSAHVAANIASDLSIAVMCKPGIGKIAGSARANGRPVRFEIENALTHERRELAGVLDGNESAFEFQDVAAGSWKLRAHCPGIWRWNPPVLDVSTPTAGLVLSPIEPDPAHVRAIKFRAFDATTGDRIDHFEVQVQCDGPGGELQTKTTGFGNLVFESVPDDAPIDWSVAAEGYVPARGDRRTFERPGEMDLVRVKLVRGWQRDVEVRDATTRAPLAGARVIVDGATIGMTDTRGVLRLDRPAAPRTIVVEFDGWIVSGGSIGSDGTWSSDTPFSVQALLRRR